MQPFFIIFSNLGLGGIQRKIVDIVNFLAVKQPTLKIYILLRKKREFNLTREIINKKAKIVYYPGWLKIRIPFFFPVFVLWQVWKLKPLAILAFDSPPGLSAIWAKLVFFWRKIKVVISEDPSWVPSRQIFLNNKNKSYAFFLNFLVKIFYPFADIIFTVNKLFIKDLVRTYSFPPQKVKLIHNWTTLVQRELPSLSKKYDLIYIGRLVKVKNLHFLLKGIKKLKKIKPNIRLCLIGEGDEEWNLKFWVRENHLEKNVIFLEPKTQIENYLKQAKIFVLASKSEGFPLAVLEAMALGIPVISSNYPSVREIIKDGRTGFIYESLNGFVKKTLNLLENDSLRKKIGYQAREYVKDKHSLENINQYLKALGLKK